MLGGRGTPEELFDWDKASAPMLVWYTKSRMGWSDGSEFGNDNGVRTLRLGLDFKDI
jgi:hypothetical protein